MELKKYLSLIHNPDNKVMEQSENRWNSIAKPLYSLGKLETIVTKLSGIYRNLKFNIDNRCVVVFCADNGIYEEGVTQTSSDVTAVVAKNFTRDMASVNHMAKVAGAKVIPVDVGMLTEVDGNIIVKKIRRGSCNFTKAPAMTREECEKTIIMGIELVGKLKKDGYSIIATGEMGIGNTTTSSAVASVLLGIEPEIITGVGAGLSKDGLHRKVSAIKRGIEFNKPKNNDPIDILHKLGGYDIAGMVGMFLGGGIYNIPVIIDGFISSVAALVAYIICPTTKGYMIPSHISKEPGGHLVMDALGLEPILDCGMCLGEGTGAVAIMPILDMAVAVFQKMSTFDDIEIESYKPLD